ncbi:hypothetical protein AQJ67_33555 [Streptomyces caeruleatus]|uniref:Uncharacterized protein n=1 Tax=Streptomyces caeruleatus TaxID=661399 RepID=A0A101TPP4_9ACTN|nr:hypothetical protein AQJ67_33555 [Streptomyces caeruleatus]
MITRSGGGPAGSARSRALSSATAAAAAMPARREGTAPDGDAASHVAWSWSPHRQLPHAMTPAGTTVSPTTPARLPARLTSWHGKPAVRTSTGSTSDHSTAVTSPWLGTSGQWCARMRAAYWCLSSGSYWQCHATDAPRTSHTAMSRPPYPLHREPTRSVSPSSRASCPGTSVNRSAISCAALSRVRVMRRHPPP